MIEFITFLKDFGSVTFEYLWFPLFVWTVIAIPITILLRQSESIPAVYQYHSRVALLLALPLGIVGSYLTGIIGQSVQSAVPATKLIVVQNPITVTATASDPAISYTDPMLWIGITGALFLAGTIFLLIKMIANIFSLQKMGRNLDFMALSQVKGLNISNSSERPFQKTMVAFSDDTNIPFTYGWFRTKIVIPADLNRDTDKCAMAVQHELMHIKHRDFLLNGVLMFVKALFWFHPLTHYLHNSGQEYREITCDSEVLAGNQFSKKSYASLLFELAERDYRNSQLAMSMAVNPSSLKKRIKIMSTQTITTAKFRTSFLLTLVTAGLLVFTISCSDISDNGITNTELQQAQSQIQAQSDNSDQIFFLNGERLTDQEKIDKLGRVKSKYIKSIEILKGEKAVKEYGEEAENGVVQIFMWNETIDKAFTDLKEQDGSVEDLEQDDFFVAVEQMPELVGGLASLQKKINYPETAKKAGIEGRVIVQFIVDEQGNVENPQIIRGIGGGADKEALRVVKQAKFEPGKQRGQPVRVQYSLPIVFELQQDDEIQKESTSSYLESPKVDGQQFEVNNLKTTESGVISGTLLDASTGEPLSGANIVVTSAGKGAASNQNGKFKITGLSSGNHELQITYVGYSKAILNVEI